RWQASPSAPTPTAVERSRESRPRSPPPNGRATRRSPGGWPRCTGNPRPARQIDDGRRAVHDLHPGTERSPVPAEVLDDAGTGARRPREVHDLVAGRRQVGGQRRPEEATAAGKHYPRTRTHARRTVSRARAAAPAGTWRPRP